MGAGNTTHIKKLTPDSKAIEKLYQKIDTNSDNMIDIDELYEYVQAHSKALQLDVTVDQLKSEIAKFDFNGDGKLNRREFRVCVEALNLAALEGKALAKAKSLQLQKAFRFFDADKTGTLSVTEFVSILTNPLGGEPYTKEEAEALIKRYDKNADQVLSYEEFASWWDDSPDVVYDPKAVAEALEEQRKLDEKNQEQESKRVAQQELAAQEAARMAAAQEEAAMQEAALAAVPSFVPQADLADYASRRAAYVEQAQEKAKRDFDQVNPEVTAFTEEGASLRFKRKAVIEDARRHAEEEFDADGKKKYAAMEAVAEAERSKMIAKAQEQMEAAQARIAAKREEEEKAKADAAAAQAAKELKRSQLANEIILEESSKKKKEKAAKAKAREEAEAEAATTAKAKKAAEVAEAQAAAKKQEEEKNAKQQSNARSEMLQQNNRVGGKYRMKAQ